MIYNFIYPLADIFQPFNLFRYLTFRSIAAFLTALIISFIIGGTLIRWLRSMQAHGQPIREDGPVSHILSKKGTPTMGGLLILIALTVATLLWADLANRQVWVILGVTVAFGAIGFYDDYLKVTKQTHGGFAGLLAARAGAARRRSVLSRLCEPRRADRPLQRGARPRRLRALRRAARRRRGARPRARPKSGRRSPAPPRSRPAWPAMRIAGISNDPCGSSQPARNFA